MADNNSEIIGGIGVTIRGDFGDLGADFDAAVALAVQQGATLAEAIQSAMARPDVTPVTDAMNAIGPAAQAAAEQMSLFGDAADNIPFANAAGQLNLFTTELEPFTAGMQAASDTTAAAVVPVQSLSEVASDAAQSTAGLLTTLLQFVGIQASIEALKEFAEACIEVYANVQQADRALTVLDGSANQSAATIERLKSMASADALSFPQLLTAQVRMQAAGIALDRIPALLEAAAGPAKAFGTDIDTVAQRLTTMVTNGTVATRSLNSLGISAQQMADVMGVAAGEVTKQFKAMDESSRLEVIEEAMHRLAGVVAADAGNIKDQWQELKNQADFLFLAIGQDIAPAALAFVGFMRDAVSNTEYLEAGIKNLLPSMDGLQVALVAIDAAAMALNVKLGALLAIVELTNSFLSYLQALHGVETATGTADVAFERLITTVNQAIPSTGTFRDQFLALGAAFKQSGDVETYERGLNALMNAFHQSTGFVAAAATGIHTFTLGLEDAKEKANKFKVASNFGDIKPIPTSFDSKDGDVAEQAKLAQAYQEAQVQAAVLIQTTKDLSAARQADIAWIAKYYEALAKNPAAFDMAAVALPQLNALQLGIGNVTKELGPLGETAKQALATLTTEAQASMAPMTALDRVLKSLGQRDELNALQQYAKNVADINSALAGTAITATQAGDMMKEAWLKAHPDITKADDGIQRVIQHMADLRTAQSMGIISSAQMSADMLKDWEKISPVIKQVEGEIHSMFNRMDTSIASSIIHWRGFQSSVVSIFQSLGESAIRILLSALFAPLEKKIAEQTAAFLASHVRETAAATTAASAQAAAAASSAAATKVIALSQIAQDAAVAYAGAYAATAMIPFIGPELAPAAAASAYAGTMAAEGMAAFAEGGTVGGPLGSPQIILAHGGEQVLSLDQLAGRAALGSPQMILANGGEQGIGLDQISGRAALPSAPASSSTLSTFSSVSSTHSSHQGNVIHFHGNVSGVTKNMVADVFNSGVKQTRRIGARW